MEIKEWTHQASCLSCFGILKILYEIFLKSDDRFILSKFHAYPALKSLTSKIEYEGGSLGMGLGVACGIALSKKIKRELGMVVCLVGDGELYEGSCWEAIMFASANKLTNLICIVDRNYMSASDFTENFMPLEPLTDKFDSFGWDGRLGSEEDLLSWLKTYRLRITEKPKYYVVNTIKGQGYKELEGDPMCHTRKI